MFFLYLYILALPTYCLSLDNFQFPKDRSGIEGRIIGGTEVTPHSYPFLAGLLIYYDNALAFCGGTLITPRYVLTAAHCLMNNPSSVDVILGAHNVKVSETSQVILTSTNYVIHEDFNVTTVQNDVALVRLPEEVTMNEYISTVVYQVNKTSENYEEHNGTVVGWGYTEDSNDLSDGLRKVDNLILTNEQCRSIDPYDKVIVDTHVCFNGTGPVGACNGDSGGPLLVDKLQVGIASFGYKSCVAGKPTVFTRVVEFEEWIAKHSKGQNIVCNIAVLVALVLFSLCNY